MGAGMWVVFSEETVFVIFILIRSLSASKESFAVSGEVLIISAESMNQVKLCS